MAPLSGEYEYFVKLGAGSNAVLLSFDPDNTATITFTTIWMGQGKKTYRLSCFHQSITSTHGFLRVVTIEQEGIGLLYSQHHATAYRDDAYGLHVPEEAQTQQQIVYEYLKLSRPVWHFSGDRVLDDIRLTTGAQWNDTFTLFLFQLPLTDISEDAETKSVIGQLDRLKLRQVGDDSVPDEDE